MSNRSDIVESLSKRFPDLAPKDTYLAVNTILTAITNTLASGGRIEIRGFGSFRVNYRKPRQGRNPATGESVEVRGKKVPHFKPGKELSQRVDANSGIE